MAGWSNSKEGYEFENEGFNHVNHNVSCFNLDFSLEGGDFDDCKDTLQRLFDQVIPIYLREVSVGMIVRPLPALLGNGEKVDLFRLFWAVKKKGGFDTVSEKGLWASVAKECLLSAAPVSSVKLVYIKYLKEFDGWMQKVFRDKRSEDYSAAIFKKLDLVLVETQELIGMVCSEEDKMEDDGEVGTETDDKTGSSVDFNDGKHRSQFSDGCDFNKVHHNKENIYDETGICVDLGTCTSELVFSNGEDLNNVNQIIESSNDSEKDMCIQGGESIMSSIKCVGDNVMSSKKIILGSEVRLDKVQGKVELHSRQCDDNLLLSARRIADKVVRSQNEGKNLWAADVNNEVHENRGNIKDGYGKVLIQDDASVELSSTSVGNEVAVSRKRKWESTSLPEMLNWIAHAAKRSDDPAFGIVPGPNKWNDHGTEEYWMQALLAREALLIRRPNNANLEESSLQKKRRMHPSMYEDIISIHQSAEGVRCSKRIPSSKSQFCPCCTHASPHKAAHDRKSTSSPHSVEVPSTPAFNAWLIEEASEKHVSVGLTFQAEVPEWTSVVLESDSKWLGTRVWTPEDVNNKSLVEKHPIGKGRQSSCSCSLPGSSACVKFHIAEERLKLKQALGGVFYRWKFDRMGEEVSLSWTIEEEKRFKKMVLENTVAPTALNKFWKKAYKLFPSKTREKLVSYYFNVLVLRRRSYQNRVTPKNIDSDDDENEFGSVGDYAYLEGNNALESNLPECPLNMQVTNLE